MTFSLQCPQCSAKLNVEDRLRGRTVACPKCKGRLAIPAAQEPVEVNAATATKPSLAAVAPKTQTAAASLPLPSAEPKPLPTSTDVATPAPRRKAPSPAAIAIAASVAGLIGLGCVVVTVVLWWTLSKRSDAKPIIAANPAIAATPTLAPPTAPAPPPPAPTSNTVAPAQADQMAVSATGSVAAAQQKPSQAVDSSAWASPADLPRGVQVKFPAKAEPFDPFEGQEKSIARDFGQAVMKSAKPTMLRATSGGRTFSFSAVALRLSGMPVDVYLDRAAVNLELMNPGFKQQAIYRPKAEPVIALDALLRSDTQTRIVRIAHDGIWSIGLSVDGPLEMTYDDPLAQAFLSTLQMGEQRIAAMELVKDSVASEPPPATTPPVAVASSPLVNPLLLPQPVQPLTNDWQTVRGQKIAFQVKLPSAQVSRPEPAKLFAPSQQYDILVSSWKYLAVAKSEIIYLNQGKRRFLVVAAEVPSKNVEWYDLRGNATNAMEPPYQFFEQPNTTWKALDDGESGKSAQWSTRIKSLDSSENPVRGTRIVHRRSAGQYGFLLVLESDDLLDPATAEEMQFFRDFVAPANAIRFE